MNARHLLVRRGRSAAHTRIPGSNFFRAALAAVTLVFAAESAPAQFSSGSVVVYQVGNGTGPLVATGNVVILRGFHPDGTAAGTPIPMNSTGATAKLIASGTEGSEGLLTLSADGRILNLTGYNATPDGTIALPTTRGTEIRRTVANVTAGATTSYFSFDDFASEGSPRGAIFNSFGAAGVWMAGSTGGVRGSIFSSSPTTQLSATPTDIRGAAIVGGQLYVSTASGSSVRIGTVGTGTPLASGQTITNLPGFPTTGSPHQFFFARLGDPSFGGPNVLYVADDLAGGGQIQKYTFDGATWASAGAASAAGVRGLTGVVTGDNQVALYGTTGGIGSSGGGSLYAFTDPAATTASISGLATTVATAGPLTAFRGVAFAPVRQVWSGAADNQWNLTSGNWTNDSPFTPEFGRPFVNAHGATFGNIAADTAITVGAGVNPLAVEVSNAANAYTFTSIPGGLGVQGLGRITKTGAGTLILNSPNVYTGGTFVSGGTLLVTNLTGSATGSGRVTVNSGGTLGGTGSIAGEVLVNSGGRVGGGQGANTQLTLTGNITFRNNAVLAVRVAPGVGPADTSPTGGGRLAVAGQFGRQTVTDLLRVALLDDGLIADGTVTYTRRVATYGSLLNLTEGQTYTAVDNVFTLSGSDFAIGSGWSVAVGGGDIVVTFVPVPEPACVLGIAAGVAAAAGLLRRRRGSRGASE